MKNTIQILIIITSLLHSCQSRPEYLKKIVQEWQGKEIHIPAKIEYTILGRDTLCSDLWNKPYKILTYVDSVGCTNCRMRLPRWRELIDSSKYQELNVTFLFVIHSTNYNLLDREITANEFHYPVIYDYHNLFDKLNHFPPEPYRTFLLDKDNKVLLIGSPVDNPKMWALYRKAIALH